MNLVLYGPPNVGKSLLGPLVAQQLGYAFVDGDQWLADQWGRSVQDYWAAGEEALLRAREETAYRTLASRDRLVLAPGGGALLNPHTRAALEGSSVIICLRAAFETLLARVLAGPPRPLFAGDPSARLSALLQARQSLYDSFPLQLNTEQQPVEALVANLLTLFRANQTRTRFHFPTTSALFGHGLLAELPVLLAAHNLQPPYVLITDANVAPLHLSQLTPLLSAHLTFPAGEAHKTLETVRDLYTGCVQAGLERGGTVLALGGGVVGDVAGFVAATYMRGVQWVNLPTTVLAMADASLGGKTGVDLPEGKNLIGAFHPPALIVADFATLTTLPAAEIRNGLAEVLKAAIIGDPTLFSLLSSHTLPLATAIPRAAAVKVGIVNADPYEKGERALLNLGHTIGHGIELASGFRLRHGEAIGIGTVAAAQLAETLGLAAPGLCAQIATGFAHAGLPTACPGLTPAHIRAAMQADKKKARGQLKFVLPREIGEVAWGQVVPEAVLEKILAKLVNSEQ